MNGHQIAVLDTTQFPTLFETPTPNFVPLPNANQYLIPRTFSFPTYGLEVLRPFISGIRHLLEQIRIATLLHRLAVDEVNWVISRLGAAADSSVRWVALIRVAVRGGRSKSGVGFLVVLELFDTS